MHISSQVLRLALLRVFAEAGVDGADSLSFPRISTLWPQTGLRDSDLRDAVRELTDSGDLVAAKQDETLTLSLSAKARRGLHEPYGELQLASLEEEATLFIARNRRHGERPTGQRERVEDRRAAG